MGLGFIAFRGANAANFLREQGFGVSIGCIVGGSGVHDVPQQYTQDMPSRRVVRQPLAALHPPPPPAKVSSNKPPLNPETLNP